MRLAVSHKFKKRNSAVGWPPSLARLISTYNDTNGFNPSDDPYECPPEIELFDEPDIVFVKDL